MKELVIFLVGASALGGLLHVLSGIHLHERVQRRYLSKRRFSCLIGLLLVGWFGGALIVGWALTKYTLREDGNRPNEPAPSWPWQIGLAIAIIAAIALVVVVLTASTDPEADAHSHLNERRFMAELLAANGAAAVSASMAASESEFRMRPVGFAALMAVCMVVLQKSGLLGSASS